MVQDRAIVTTAEQHKVVYDLSMGAIFNPSMFICNDRIDPLTQISRSHQYSTLNISVTVEETYLHWRTNSNSYAVYRMMPFPITFSDPSLRFQGHANT